MSIVLAAIDNSAAAQPVIDMAKALAVAFGGSVEALHVADELGETATAVAEHHSVPCRVVSGDPVAAITERALSDDVIGVVVGARGSARARAVGHVAVEIVGSIAKPVLVVPPNISTHVKWRTALIAMKGTPNTVRHLDAIIRWATTARIDVVVVHVDTDESLPSFSDQAAHATTSYAEEFRARFLSSVTNARLELRVGDPVEQILDVADAVGADVVVVGWTEHRRTPTRAIAIDILERCRVPVLLITQNP